MPPRGPNHRGTYSGRTPHPYEETRVGLGLTQSELAARAGITLAVYRHLIRQHMTARRDVTERVMAALESRAEELGND